MKLVQLEYFCAVCRYHSITRAAEELYVTQPTISVAIRELEKELKLRLFHHEKNRISIAQEGEAFYRRAEAVLKETRAMVTEFSSLGEKDFKADSVYRQDADVVIRYHTFGDTFGGFGNFF